MATSLARPSRLLLGLPLSAVFAACLAAATVGAAQSSPSPSGTAVPPAGTKVLPGAAPASSSGAPAKGAAEVLLDAQAGTVTVPALVAAPPADSAPPRQFLLASRGAGASGAVLVTDCSAKDVEAALLKIGVKTFPSAAAAGPPPESRVRLYVEYLAGDVALRRPVQQWLADAAVGKSPADVSWTVTGMLKSASPGEAGSPSGPAEPISLIGLGAAGAVALIQTSAECRPVAKELPAAGTAVRLIIVRGDGPDPFAPRRVHVFVSGRVQGVGYRDYTWKCARDLGLTGWVSNLADRRVEAVIEGPAAKVAELLDRMKRGPRLAHVSDLAVTEETPTDEFKIFEVRF